jgi:hypothetical protein
MLQLAAEALASLWKLPWSTTADVYLAASKPSSSSMDQLILRSPWFNYYEKLMLWHIWSKASRALQCLVPAEHDAQSGTEQPGTEQPGAQLPLTQEDVEWIKMLADDFHARGKPEETKEECGERAKTLSVQEKEMQQEMQQRLNWHEWCANRLWQLHMLAAEEPASFQDRASLMRAIHGSENRKYSEYLVADGCSCLRT